MAHEEPTWILKVCEMKDGTRWFGVNGTDWMSRERAASLYDCLGYLLTQLVDDVKADE